MFTKFYNENLRQLFEDGHTSDARICVVGIGGGGGNAINNMVQKGIDGVDFIAINTDSQVLASNDADYRIQAGKETTGGLGAGARPEIGAKALQESREEIKRMIEPYDLVFITAGMGGGTGTGGAPVVASIAREQGTLAVAVVTRPFACESPRRMQAAEEGIDALRQEADTLLVIPNERLLDIANDRTSLVEAFRMADEVLYDATRGISDLITHEGLVNLDFADVETTMRGGGLALLGMSTEFSMHQGAGPVGKSADGKLKIGSRAEKAAIEAISSPLFDGRSIRGAKTVLVNVTGGPSLGIREAMSATEVIQAEAGDESEVIFGAVIDEEMEGRFQVTVIATGLEEKKNSNRAIRIQSNELDQLKKRNGHVNGESPKGPSFLSDVME